MKNMARKSKGNAKQSEKMVTENKSSKSKKTGKNKVDKTNSKETRKKSTSRSEISTAGNWKCVIKNKGNNIEPIVVRRSLRLNKLIDGERMKTRQQTNAKTDKPPVPVVGEITKKKANNRRGRPIKTSLPTRKSLRLLEIGTTHIPTTSISKKPIAVDVTTVTKPSSGEQNQRFDQDMVHRIERQSERERDQEREFLFLESFNNLTYRPIDTNNTFDLRQYLNHEANSDDETLSATESIDRDRFWDDETVSATESICRNDEIEPISNNPIKEEPPIDIGVDGGRNDNVTESNRKRCNGHVRIDKQAKRQRLFNNNEIQSPNVPIESLYEIRFLSDDEPTNLPSLKSEIPAVLDLSATVVAATVVTNEKEVEPTQIPTRTVILGQEPILPTLVPTTEQQPISNKQTVTDVAMFKRKISVVPFVQPLTPKNNHLTVTDTNKIGSNSQQPVQNLKNVVNNTKPFGELVKRKPGRPRNIGGIPPVQTSPKSNDRKIIDRNDLEPIDMTVNTCQEVLKPLGYEVRPGWTSIDYDTHQSVEKNQRKQIIQQIGVVPSIEFTQLSNYTQSKVQTNQRSTPADQQSLSVQSIISVADRVQQHYRNHDNQVVVNDTGGSQFNLMIAGDSKNNQLKATQGQSCIQKPVQTIQTKANQKSVTKLGTQVIIGPPVTMSNSINQSVDQQYRKDDKNQMKPPRRTSLNRLPNDSLINYEIRRKLIEWESDPALTIKSIPKIKMQSPSKQKIAPNAICQPNSIPVERRPIKYSQNANLVLNAKKPLPTMARRMSVNISPVANQSVTKMVDNEPLARMPPNKIIKRRMTIIHMVHQSNNKPILVEIIDPDSIIDYSAANRPNSFGTIDGR